MKLLGNLAPTRRGWRLAAFDIPSWDIPRVLVGRVNEEYPLLLIDEEGTRGYARRREGVAPIFHLSERTVRGSGEMEAPGELLECDAPRAAGRPQPAEDELTADRMMLDLLGRKP